MTEAIISSFTALIVEDEPVLARFIQSVLTANGFAVRTASNRAEIVAALDCLPIPDLILLDVVLPDANGFDILRQVRNHPQLKYAATLMLTGAATRADVMQAIESGADGYVTKPFTSYALDRAIRKVLGLPGAGAVLDVTLTPSASDAA